MRQPPDVLIQGFLDHWQEFFGNIEWLGIESLSIYRSWLPTEEIVTLDMGREETVGQYKDYFATSTELSPGRARLWSYVREHGTWPRPIILVDNADGLVRHPNYEIDAPFGLIEGYNRLAVLRLLVEREHEVRPQHPVWCLSPK